MSQAIQFLLSVWAAAASWLTRAALDLGELGRAMAQHATPAAAELIALSAMLLFTATFATRRLRRHHRARVEKHAKASVVSGIARFQAASAHLAKGVPPVEHALEAGHTAPRIETRVMDVDPEDEQNVINLMARFKWQLKSSTPVHTSDTKIRERDGHIYSTTETDDYVHLVFERDLDADNIAQVKALEAEYFGIVIPRHPSYVGPVLVMLASLITGPFAIPVWLFCIWWIFNIRKRRRHAEAVTPGLRMRQMEILKACDAL